MTVMLVSCDEAAKKVVRDLRLTYHKLYPSKHRPFSPEVYLEVMSALDRFIGGHDTATWCAIAREVEAKEKELDFVQSAKPKEVDRVRRHWMNQLAFDSMLVLIWRKLKK